jgi:hypothetical protein
MKLTLAVNMWVISIKNKEECIINVEHISPPVQLEYIN